MMEAFCVSPLYHYTFYEMRNCHAPIPYLEVAVLFHFAREFEGGGLVTSLFAYSPGCGERPVLML